ncbi:GEVED domain-containing protein [Chryseobacterium sp.]|uniref:GEVED domain-containing protein n=1 Tax=Chryseobacterium sp. TaxID=1871047 RepID=UPI003219F8BE
MIKKLLFLLSLVMGASFFQAKNKLSKSPESLFSCDVNPPTNIQVSTITFTSAVISWTPNTDVTNHVLRYRRVGTPVWMVVPVIGQGQNNYTLSNLAPCEHYEVQVASICASQGLWSTQVSFISKVNYCTSASVDSGMGHISNVTLTSGNPLPMTSNSGPSNYTDYGDDPDRRIQLMAGSTGNQLSVTKTWTGTPSPLMVKAWIDFNANGIFEASEAILSSPASTVSTVSSGIFTVPVNAYIGLNAYCGAVMRVMISADNSNDGCGTFNYGEVEDYRISFSGFLSTLDHDKKKGSVIYPNPTSDILNVSGLDGNEYEIYNAVGQKVSGGKIAGQKVDVHHLTKGIYFLQIKESEKVSQLKFIKK